VISLTCNVDHNFPFNATNPDDVAAANRALAFFFGWFYDPIIFGKYPDEMTSLITDGRLPTFTPEESQMVKGSLDFVGMNHYTSSFTKDVPDGKGGNWYTDARSENTKIGIDGKIIGPTAQSSWLNVVP
jgi:beta-glucosidase